MAATAWIGTAIRGSIALFGLWYFISVPDDQVFSGRIINLLNVEEHKSLIHYFWFVEFVFPLLYGLLISHSIFWPCIARRKVIWPRWGEPALRALDYLWYAGAAASLVFLAAQAQGELAVELRRAHESELEQHRDWLKRSLQEVPDRCDANFLPPTEGASDHYKTAYTVLSAVCDELREAGADGRELWIVDTAVLSRCDKMNVDYWPSGWGENFPADLSDSRILRDAYSSITAICRNDYHIRRISEKLDEIKPFEEAVAFSAENSLLSGYVNWFALLLAFRLSRTTAEVVEAIRSARAR